MPQDPLLRPAPSAYAAPAPEVHLHEPEVQLEAVPEAVVQAIWQHQRLRGPDFTTSDGQPLRVLHPGRLNTDQGPDFSQARIRLDGLDWSGDVEIHRTSGDWFRHGHAQDAQYNRVVLHVTLVADLFTGRLTRADGSRLPELVLTPYLDASLRHLLHHFFTAPTALFPCAALWPSVPASVRASALLTLGMGRIQARAAQLNTDYQRLPDLEALLYTRVFRTLGYAKNGEAMQTLARLRPLAEARTYTDPLTLEAAYLGTAGLLPAADGLPAPEQDYVRLLHAAYARLAPNPPSMPTTHWRFFRLRPVNFPTLRLAQAVALVQPGGLFAHDPLGKLLAACAAPKPLTALRQCFTVQPGPFWQTHVQLVRPLRRPHAGTLGRQRIDRLLTHAVFPVLLRYAEQTDNVPLQGQLWALYTQVPARSDAVTRRYTAPGVTPRHALEAQGMHALHAHYCTQGRCLECPIGAHILQRTP